VERAVSNFPTAVAIGSGGQNLADTLTYIKNLFFSAKIEDTRICGYIYIVNQIRR
jgi:hypothetical protein